MDRLSVLESTIHGAIRVQTSKLSIDDLNDNKLRFQRIVIDEVQSVLWQFGIIINTANIAKIQEDERANGEMGYLKARERKKLTEAIQQSEVDVGEATKRGNIGKKQREAATRQEIAALESETQLKENEAQQKITISKADLDVVEAKEKKRAKIQLIEAEAETNKIQKQLQAEVELIKAVQQLESLRATELTHRCI